MDAYVLEAQAISIAQQELDARFRALRQKVKAEAPERFTASSDSQLGSGELA